MTTADKKRMLSFNTNDAIWHFNRRKQILEENGSEVSKYFGPNSWSFPILVATVLFRYAMLIYFANTILGLASVYSLLARLGFILAYCVTIDQFLLHSSLTFSHEHSHNLIFDHPSKLPLVDFVLDFQACSFAENLKYVYSHSRSHHPTLGDNSADSEILSRDGDCPQSKFQYLIQMTSLIFPGVIIVQKLLKKSGPASLKLPKNWAHRKRVSMLASVLAIIFVFVKAGWVGSLMQVWTLSIYLSSWSVWRKGQSIAEHVTQSEVPTYSTMGLLMNSVFFNTGYHDEHHTFPLVSWMYLPKLKALNPDVFKHENKASYLTLWSRWMTSGCPNYRAESEQTASWMGQPQQKKSQ